LGAKVLSLRTPLGRVLGLGTAKDGTEHFMSQRISAIALVLLGCWFMYSMFTIESMAYLEVMRFIAAPLNSVLLSLLCITAAWHSYLGVQVVVEDYVHAHGVKLFSLIASRFAHVFLAVASVYAILRIGFTA
jgi:succinate dehydrogenase / fumarate reductase membrane anchor subunit